MTYLEGSGRYIYIHEQKNSLSGLNRNQRTIQDSSLMSRKGHSKNTKVKQLNYTHDIPRFGIIITKGEV